MPGPAERRLLERNSSQPAQRHDAARLIQGRVKPILPSGALRRGGKGAIPCTKEVVITYPYAWAIAARERAPPIYVSREMWSHVAEPHVRCVCMRGCMYMCVGVSGPKHTLPRAFCRSLLKLEPHRFPKLCFRIGVSASGGHHQWRGARAFLQTKKGPKSNRLPSPHPHHVCIEPSLRQHALRHGHIQLGCLLQP